MQVKYNVLEHKPETSGLLEKCQELGVTLVAHSPLQQGILTGAHCMALRCIALRCIALHCIALTYEEYTCLKMR